MQVSEQPLGAAGGQLLCSVGDIGVEDSPNTCPVRRDETIVCLAQLGSDSTQPSGEAGREFGRAVRQIVAENPLAAADRAGKATGPGQQRLPNAGLGTDPTGRAVRRFPRSPIRAARAIPDRRRASRHCPYPRAARTRHCYAPSLRLIAQVRARRAVVRGGVRGSLGNGRSPGRSEQKPILWV